MSLRRAMAHRNLLYLLSLKELRTRYKKSVLGWAWSLFNPLSQMLILRNTAHTSLSVATRVADVRRARNVCGAHGLPS